MTSNINRFFVVAAVILGLIVFAQSMLAWGPGGHMIVAYIALGRLNANARAQVDKLVLIKIEPVAETEKSLDFVNASHWPDDLRDLGQTYADTFPLHFIDEPFSVDGTTLPTNLPEMTNITTALAKYVDILKNSSDDNARAQALRFVIHFVGDVQQPLHCSTLVSKAHPMGDQGGNEFLFKLRNSSGKTTSEKLHSYWDGGIEDFPPMGPNFAAPPLTAIPPAVAKITAAFPDDGSWKNGAPDNYMGWVMESSKLAQTVAYKGIKPGQSASATYNATALKTADQRVAWGGYRLAELLNSIWP